MSFNRCLCNDLLSLKIELQRTSSTAQVFDDDQAALRKLHQQLKDTWSSTFSGEYDQDDGRNEFLLLFGVVDHYIDQPGDSKYLRLKAIRETERLIVYQESFTPAEAARQKLLSELAKPLYQVNVNEVKQAFEEFSKEMEDMAAAITV